MADETRFDRMFYDDDMMVRALAESMKYVCTLLVLRTIYMMVLGILFNSSGELGEIIYLQSRKYPTQESMQISCSLFER